MSKLEDLVPPLELCSKIPEGKFADSAMVYVTSKYSLNHRFGDRLFFDELKGKNDYQIIPAPTLQEILAELEKRFDDVCVFNASEKGFWYVQIEDMGIPKCYSEYERNPATAALKLWMELNGEGAEK